MASVPFHLMRYAGESLPDSAFEKIPYVGPKFFKEKEHSTSHGGNDRSHRDSNSDSDSDRSRRASRRHGRRRHDRHDRHHSRDRNRGYDSDRTSDRRSDRRTRGYEDAPYFPPPPQQAVPIINEPAQHGGPPNNGAQGSFMPPAYSPQNYGANPGARDSYFTGHPQDQVPITPPTATTAGMSSTNHSSAADKYLPPNYDQNHSPYARSQGRAPSSPGSGALALRHPSPNRYNTYSPSGYSPYDSEEDYDRRPRRRSKSRGSARSRSRAASERIKQEFGKHKKDIETASLGVIAGGIIGHVISGQMGGRRRRRSSRDNIIGAAIGAAIGGAGSVAYERRQEKRKSLRREDHGYDSY